MIESSLFLLLFGLTENIFTLRPNNIRKACKKIDPDLLETMVTAIDEILQALDLKGEITKSERRLIRKLRHIRTTLQSLKTVSKR